MTLKQIYIDQQMAQIGINNNSRAGMNITHPRRTGRARSETPQIQIEKTSPSFTVNWKKINAEMNIYGPVELTKKHRDMGKQTVLRGIKRAGDDGDFLGNTRIRGQKVSQLSRNKAMAEATRKKEFNIGLMPQNMAEMTWDTGSISINFSKHSMVIDWDEDYLPELTVDQNYPVEINLQTQPYFSITVGDLTTPGSAGRYIDASI